MDTFFPSEIARLVLGYLKEDECLKSWETFLEESSNLREYFALFKRGKVYSTNVNGYSLLDILNEYCVLKFQAINKDLKTDDFSSKSEIIGTLKEDGFIESTKQTVDCAFQKYLSPSDNLKDKVSTDSSPDICELPNPNNSCSKEIKKHCTGVAENLPVVKPIETYQRNKKLNTELNDAEKGSDVLHQSGVTKRRKNFSNSSISPESLTSFIQSLSDQLNRKENPTVRPPNINQHSLLLKDNSQTLSKSKPSDKEKAISSTETVSINGDDDDDDDDDIEIVEEIKKIKKKSDNPSSKVKTSCSNNISTSEKAIDNIAAENSQINEPGHGIDFFNNSIGGDLQTNNITDIRTEQTDSNHQNKINVPESKTDSSNNQGSFVDSGTYIQPGTAVNEMSFSYPHNYIFPSYAPSNSFTNNAPIYVVLNTPAAPRPIINGTILTMPTVQTNSVPCPLLPTVSTAFVNNSITSPVNSLLTSLPIPNIDSNVDKIPFPSSKVPQNEVLPSVGVSKTSKKKNIPKTEVEDKVLKSSHKTYSKESQTSKVLKRENSNQKKGQKKQIKASLLPKEQLIPTPESGILSLIDYKGEHSTNKGRSVISSDNCPSKIQKASKRKRSKEKKGEKSKKKKMPDKSPSPLKVKITKPKPKPSWLQSILGEQFPQLGETGHNLNDSNLIKKTNREMNDCTESISTFSSSRNNFNNSTVVKSSLPGVKENRVLKVMLSDIFVNIHHKTSGQESNSNAELSMQEKSKNQIYDPEKTAMQNDQTLL